MIPSVTLRMNRSANPGESLYGGGEDGNGRVYVSMHDAILDKSDGYKHAANLYRHLQYEANEGRSANEIDDQIKPSPYFVLVETDGGADHNHTHLANQLAVLGLFLVGNMDKIF